MGFNPEGGRVDFDLFAEYNDISTNRRVILKKAITILRATQWLFIHSHVLMY